MIHALTCFWYCLDEDTRGGLVGIAAFLVVFGPPCVIAERARRRDR